MVGTISMTLEELQQAIYHLSAQEQLSLLETLVQALKVRQKQAVDRKGPSPEDAPRSGANSGACEPRHSLVNQLRGCLKKPGQPIPTDADIEAMREERLVEKYLM